MAVYTKKWNGSAWVTAPVKKWNGSSWVDAYTYKWNGSSWVQIYPETAVTTSTTLYSGTKDTYKTSGWKGDGIARQGNGSTWGGSTSNYGYFGISSYSITGCGGISAVHSATFSGTRGGSGYYNNEQTVKFYRSAQAPSSVPSVEGNFTSTFTMPGKDTAFSGKSISMGSNGLNWMNAVGSKPYLYIYSNVAADYASFTGSCSVWVNYTYIATAAAFEGMESRARAISSTDSFTDINNTTYHVMPIYRDEVDMTLEEIIKRREDGIVQDIDPTTLNREYVPKPWSKEYSITEDREGNQILVLEVYGLGMDDEVQLSVDGVNWATMTQTIDNFCFMEGTLPPDFNKTFDWIYVRCIDKKTDTLHFTLDIEPVIILA